MIASNFTGRLGDGYSFITIDIFGILYIDVFKKISLLVIDMQYVDLQWYINEEFVYLSMSQYDTTFLHLKSILISVLC